MAASEAAVASAVASARAQAQAELVALHAHAEKLTEAAVMAAAELAEVKAAAGREATVASAELAEKRRRREGVAEALTAVTRARDAAVAEVAVLRGEAGEFRVTLERARDDVLEVEAAGARHHAEAAALTARKARLAETVVVRDRQLAEAQRTVEALHAELATAQAVYKVPLTRKLADFETGILQGAVCVSATNVSS